MECQKIMNWSGNTSNQSSRFRTKTWADINDDWRGTYSTEGQIKFKTLMLKSSLCDYSDTYILVKGIISVAALVAGEDKNNKEYLKIALHLLMAYAK